MERDTKVSRRQFMAAGAGLGLSTLLPNVHSGRKGSGRTGVPNEELTCVAKIKEIQIYELPIGQADVFVKCLALDACGNRFSLELYLGPKDPAECDRIIRDLETDSIYWIRGTWSMEEEDPHFAMTILYPTYWPYQPLDLKRQLSISEMSRYIEDPPTV